MLNENTLEHAFFLDGIAITIVSDLPKNLKLYNLVTNYQVHSHSRSCRKYKSYTYG